MIGTISVRVNAGHPNVPLAKVQVLRNSAVTIGVIDVPKQRGALAVSGVAIAITNASGTTVSKAATFFNNTWTSTFPASHFATAGTISGGLAVTASGTDETGAAVTSWALGRGDIVIVDAQTTPTPGTTVTNVTDQTLAGETISLETEDDMHTAVKTVLQKLGATVTAFALVFGAWAGVPANFTGDTFTTNGVTWARHGALNTRTAYVVTNVTAGGGSAVTSGVTSVNGKTGVVELNAADVDAATTAALASATNALTARLMTTNDVQAIVTNDVAVLGAWVAHNVPSVITLIGQPEWQGDDEYEDGYWEWSCQESEYRSIISDDDLLHSDDVMFYDEFDQAYSFTATRTRTTANALGIAYSRDLPALTNGLATAASVTAATNATATLQYTVSQWEALWNGDEVRVTITNYFGTQALPSLYIEQRTNDTSQATNLYKVVWDERWRWNDFLAPYIAFTNTVNAELAQKADRAWGYYDSHSGEYVPDSTYTWMSSPKIAIAGGMAYQRTVTTDGAIWVLESNGLVTETGGATSNGFFRISDDEDNTIFSIVKGSNRTVGATAGGLTTSTDSDNRTHLHIAYNVVSDAHPTAYVCDALSNLNWKAETDAACLAYCTWTGHSGAWTNEVYAKTSQPQLFVKAEYVVGGDTIISNAAPVAMDCIYLGGQKYRLGTATISGNTVLTLTAAN